MSKTSFGRLGEDLAEKFLRQNGYKILRRNFHSRFGEIDIVAEKDAILVFVEVKARWSRNFGLPEEAVGMRKLAAIEKTGEIFRNVNRDLPEASRIDVVVVELREQNQVDRIEILENVSGL